MFKMKFSLLLLLILISGCRQRECPEYDLADTYGKYVDIVADHNVDWTNLAQLPNCNKEDLEFVIIVPQRTDIISDWPRFFLYKNIELNEFWINLCGSINGGCVGWIGPLNDEYAGKIFESLRPKDCDLCEWKLKGNR